MSKGDIKLEVCVDSIQSAVAAAEGGAARIELCSALLEGGLTPTCGVLQTLKDLISIPIFCMLRARRGNDFNYSSHEMDAMLADMNYLRQNGADGFVFGALTSLRTVDVENCTRIVRNAAGIPVTFHRAFDLTLPAQMNETVDCLRRIGFTRILSSGFRPSAAEGIDSLASLVATNHHRDIIVMPGAGIGVANLEEILTGTKCAEFHASCLPAAGEIGNGMECDVTMGKEDSQPYAVTDVHVVRKLVTIARSMAAK